MACHKRAAKIGLAGAAVLVALVVTGLAVLTDQRGSEPAASPSATSSTTKATAGEPAAIAGKGYSVTFDDEFNTLKRHVWDDHVWYDDPAQDDWLANGFQEADPSGILHLRTGRYYASTCTACQPGGWPINTVTTHTSGQTFQYGYFEARMKWTAGAGAWPAFWLISQGWANTGSCSTPAGELDIFEGQGTEPDVFYGTVHKDSSNECFSDQQNGNNDHPAGVDLTAGFHIYGMLWTASSVSWYLDDKLLMSAPTYSTDDQRMMLVLQMWAGGWTDGPDATTPDVLDTEVDWVHVWQK